MIYRFFRERAESDIVPALARAQRLVGVEGRVAYEPDVPQVSLCRSGHPPIVIGVSKRGQLRVWCERMSRRLPGDQLTDAAVFVVAVTWLQIVGSL